MEFWMFALLSFIVYMVGYALLLAGGGLSLLMARRAGELGVTQPDLAQVAPGPLFWVGLAIMLLWFLGTIIPMIAVTVRRLHDREMSGWWYLGFIVVVFALTLIPLIGTLITLVLDVVWIVVMALPGTPGPNKYGPDPLGQVDPEVFA
jgi:uncharacterized membrane protein YhaH (DUF805 family)